MVKVAARQQFLVQTILGFLHVATASKCHGSVRSVFGRTLRYKPVYKMKAENHSECLNTAEKAEHIQSYSYSLSSRECSFYNVSHVSAPALLVAEEDSIYMPVPDHPCTHQACLNGGACLRNATHTDKPSCRCTKSYEGKRCETLKGNLPLVLILRKARFVNEGYLDYKSLNYLSLVLIAVVLDMFQKLIVFF